VKVGYTSAIEVLVVRLAVVSGLTGAIVDISVAPRLVLQESLFEESLVWRGGSESMYV